MNVETGETRQLTDGECEDFEASYLPNGNIVFVSNRYVQKSDCIVHEGHGGIRTDDECWGTTIHHNVLTDCWFVAYVHKNTNEFTNNFILIPTYSSAIAFRARDDHEGTRISENVFVVKSWVFVLS